MPADAAYFHGYYRQERPAASGKNYEFLNVRGTGHYVGTVLNVIQAQVGWFGEGDDLFYVDGAEKPQIYGTGTEDYVNEAWGLRVSYGPWSGTPVAEGGSAMATTSSSDALTASELTQRTLVNDLLQQRGLLIGAGAVIAALFMGMGEAILAVEVSPTWASLWFFVILVLVLLIRPQGLLGTAERGKL